MFKTLTSFRVERAGSVSSFSQSVYSTAPRGVTGGVHTDPSQTSGVFSPDYPQTLSPSLSQKYERTRDSETARVVSDAPIGHTAVWKDVSVFPGLCVLHNEEDLSRVMKVKVHYFFRVVKTFTY